VPEERHRHYLQGRALKRAQQPADACGALLFLLSQDAAFMTGQVIPVNGGFVMN
jgi:NAD(P)-dependent dehydrogenase (short-subunit alcohol dehydrogenase family)